MNESLDAHLRSRGMNPDKTRVIVDEEAGYATFLLYNLTGQIVGFQRYNPMGEKLRNHTKELTDRATQLGVSPSRLMKYFTRVFDEGGGRRLAVWGIESISTEMGFVFIVEGIFDAIKIHNAGYPCIAVLSNNPKPLQQWLAILGKRTIGITDNDVAGSKLASLVDIKTTVPSPHNDLGDMPQEEVDIFIRDFMGTLV